MATSRKRLNPNNILLLSAFGGFIIGILNGLGIQLPLWTPLAVLIFLLIISISYWKNIDEAAKEAHKFAWYWSSIGWISLAATFYTTMQYNAVPNSLVSLLETKFNSPTEIFMAGIISSIIIQIIFYSIIWIGWWARTRMR